MTGIDVSYTLASTQSMQQTQYQLVAQRLALLAQTCRGVGITFLAQDAVDIPAKVSDSAICIIQVAQLKLMVIPRVPV